MARFSSITAARPRRNFTAFPRHTSSTCDGLSQPPEGEGHGSKLMKECKSGFIAGGTSSKA